MLCVPLVLVSLPQADLQEPTPQLGVEERLTAEEILFRMRDVYATCDTYSDTGLVEVVVQEETTRSWEQTFRTYFIRPSDYRFHIHPKSGRVTILTPSMIMSEDNGASWLSIGDVRHTCGLQDEASTPLPGIAETAHPLTLSYLFPNEFGDCYLDDRVYRLAGIEMLDGIPTYVLAWDEVSFPRFDGHLS